MGLSIDSVYFMMFPGWRTEVRSNRWHYGLRWARHLPLVLVQPELPAGAPWTCEAEPRIGNCEILSIGEHNGAGRASFSDGLAQAAQIAAYMRHRDHRRPLLWCYNPYLAFAYALVPAVIRIFHVTENYFDLEMDTSDFVGLKKAAIAISDKAICCSTGVLEGVRAATGRTDLEMIPNGCDYKFYAEPEPPAGDWPARLQPVLAAGTPIAVFAGEINLRMDFPLMHRLAERLRGVHFVYAGRVDHDWLKPEDRASWAVLLRRKNVTYLGFLEPAELPQLYRLADRGLIPYRHLPFIVKNGFPLKALEMAAAGLPVVASLMTPLLEVPEAVAVASDGEAFLTKLRQASRRTRSPEAWARADAVCRRHDYDRMFEQAVEIARQADADAPPHPASLAPIYDRVGFERTVWDLERLEPLPPPETGCALRPRRRDRVRAIFALAIAHLRATPPPGMSRGQRALWHVPPELAAWVPVVVRQEVKRIIIASPPDLPWKRRVLWHIPPAAAVLLPASLKSALKRSLRI